MVPIEFIGRYMPGWFDHAICDEIHRLAGDTAQGNALGTLSSGTDRIVGLTGTLLRGYAVDLFNTLFRLEARRMKEHGYEWGTTGRSSFTQDYGVLETITRVEPSDNRCSKSKTTSTVRRKPGASPLLFGEFLMQLCAFVFLEDISGDLPPYEETCLSVPMDPLMMAANRELEDDIRKALKEHRGNRSVLSTMLSAVARELVERNGIGEIADSVWKALSTERQKLFPAALRSTDDASFAEAPPVLPTDENNPAGLIQEAIGGESVLIFGQRPGSLGRRPRGRAVVPEQASLFG